MKRKSLIAVILFCVFMVACGKVGSEDNEKNLKEKDLSRSNNISVESEVQNSTENLKKLDGVGNEFEVPKDLKSIGITPIPWASVVFAVDGGSDRISTINPSAMSAYKSSFLEKIDPNYGKIDTSIIGSDFKFNSEELVNRGIQAMVIWDDQDMEAENLKTLGITPVMVQNKTKEALQESLRAIGQLLNKEDRANRFVKLYDDGYKIMESYGEKLEKVDKKKVLFLKNPELKIMGVDNFINEAGKMAGANLIGGKSKSITMEEIMKEDPDIILLSNFDDFTPHDFYKNTLPGQDWSQIKAVKNKQVYKVPIGIYRWDAPGVETPLMMQWMGKVIQPDVFSDLDFKGHFHDFYKEYFHYQLTKEDVEQILNEKANSDSLKIELERK